MATKKELKLRHQILTPEEGEHFEMDVYALKGLWAMIKHLIEEKEALLPELKSGESVGKLLLMIDPRGALQNMLYLCAKLGYDPNEPPVELKMKATEVVRIGVPPKEHMA